MTNTDISEHYIKQAGLILDEAKDLLRKGAWNLVVRRSQEVVELAVKAMLRRIGIEVPREHDVGWLLEELREKLPAVVQKELPRIRRVSRQLRKERETSFYGDEETGLAPSELYTQLDAGESLKEAEFILSIAKVE